ncbi:MAG: hypothetical protein J7K54_05045 [Candidatus Aenigmarchaeota archaeon]|nr:hypothetical protein [Candidatus Aenigmarchaeota archaeon]
MRVRLLKGRQNELIKKAKNGKTWKELSMELGLNSDYLRTDISKEKVLLKQETFKKLCSMAKTDFSKFVIEILDDNWGKKKGGRNSPGRTKHVNKPSLSEELSELIGIILGDGSLYWNSSRGVYALKIAGDIEKEQAYHEKIVKPMIDRLFGVTSKIEIKKNERFVSEFSKEIIKILEDFGLKRGNKKLNNVGIPSWVKENPKYLASCLRGLIDTDGSVFRMSKKDRNLVRMSFKNKSEKLLTDTRNAFIYLGFSPSKIFEKDHFFISKKSDIKKYIREINFNNQKHLRRIRETAP